MKFTTQALLSAFLLALILIACGAGQNRNESDVAETTDVADVLEGESSDYSINLLKSGRHYENLVDKLYKELLSDSEDLKKLEKSIDETNNKASELRGDFFEYDKKSESYYSSALHYTSSISDTLLKQEIVKVIEAHNESYKRKTSQLNNLLENIHGKEISLKDHHIILKLMMTLPMIENYQDVKKPSQDDLKDLIKALEKVIDQTKEVSNS